VRVVDAQDREGQRPAPESAAIRRSKAKRPTFVFSHALPAHMSREEARRRCEEAFRALAERGAR